MLKKFAAAVLCASALVTPAIAQASSLTPCSSNDLSGVTVLGCLGGFSGNLLNSSDAATVAAQLSSWYPTITTASVQDALGTSGWRTTGSSTSTAGQALVDFTAPLSGITIVGLHQGGGAGGGDTAFYVIQAGSNLDTFKWNTTAPSGAQIYGMNLTSPIPEPTTYALYLAGLAAVGFVVKRRRPAA